MKLVSDTTILLHNILIEMKTQSGKKIQNIKNKIPFLCLFNSFSFSGVKRIIHKIPFEWSQLWRRGG